MAADAFEFRQGLSILKSTGKKAKNLRELRELISAVSDESIFHHMYHYSLKNRMVEYTNDFAHWAGECLEERALSENLSNIDPYAFDSIPALREKLLHTIDDYSLQFPEPRDAMPGDEFYANETVTLIFHSGLKAGNLAEFLMALKHIDTSSLYFHIFAAKVRLKETRDDFSRWLEETLGKKELCAKVCSIDLFMHSLDGIRDHIAAAIEDEIRKDMETIKI